MKRILFAAALMLMGLAVSAQTFVGTMKVGDYTRKDVTVKMTVKGDTATITMYHVKFARMMPVKVNFQIPDIRITATQQRNLLECHNIVPLGNGKKYPEYTVRKLNGAVTSAVLSFTCTMDEKTIVYSGVINRRAE